MLLQDSTELSSAPAARAGRGLLRFARVGDRTVVTQLRGESPMKLLSPQCNDRFALAICGTLGGGLVSGDQIDLNCVAEAETESCISTQASTKVYRTAAGTC